MNPISDYIPHRVRMQLIDALVEADSDKAVAITTPKIDDLFVTEKGVPALVGIEYLAQTIAAYSSAKDGNVGAPKIGLLLGSRHYESIVEFFPIGKMLTITVHPKFVDENALGVFEGDIALNGQTVVTATLNVYQPEDVSSYFKESKHE